MVATYSICITHYNDVNTLEPSLESILNQIDSRFEVIVVDQNSTDGSKSILERYDHMGKIRLFHQSVRNRGLGREFAYEKSVGKYIISQMDMDDFFLPGLQGLVSLYHASYEGKVLRVRRSPVEGHEYFCGVTVSPRKVVERIGGWRGVNWFEDSDFWYRASNANLLAEVKFPIMVRNRANYEHRSFFARAKHRYLVFKELIRTGLPWDQVDTRIDWQNFLIYVTAWIGARLDPLPTKQPTGA